MPTMHKLITGIIRHSPRLRRAGNRLLYQYLARLDEKSGRVRLMNYGYLSLNGDGPLMPLEPEHESDRQCLQLYHKVASAVDLTDKDVLEVGSGRGGGAHYVSRALKPATYTGVDYSERAVEFCNNRYDAEGLRFVHGDAENLPLEAESFDAAINVESSHCYGYMSRFLGEVHRVLRPGGALLWTDFRSPDHLDGLYADFEAAGFTVEEEEVITPNILASLATLTDRNIALIDEGVPPFARNFFYAFAGVEGAGMQSRFANDELVYLRAVLRK